MKKVLWKVAACVAVVLMSFSVYACGDDDEGIDNVTDLYGVWEPVQAEGYEIEYGKKNTWNKEVVAASNQGEYDRLEFKEDNTFNSYYYSNGWKIGTDGITYKIEGNKIKFTHDDYAGPITIVSLNSNQSVLEMHEKMTVEGVEYEYYERITYKKVS